MSKITLNQTAGNDNAVIWIVKITINPSTIFYFSDADDKITLSGTDFDGKVTFKDSLQYLDQSIDIAYGGTLGSPGNTSIAIARYNAYTGTSDFFNDFYPATSQNYITGRQVEIGICWTGATATSEITWLYDFYVDSYSYDWNAITLNLYERAILESVECPYFEVQDQYDNGISYFPDVIEKDALGQVLPLVYGDYSHTAYSELPPTSIYTGECLGTPCLIVNPDTALTIISYHEISAFNNLERWIDGLEVPMKISRASGSTTTNDKSGARVELMDSGTAIIEGQMLIPLRMKSPDSDYEVTEVCNDDVTDYKEMDGDSSDILALRILGEASTNKIGYFSKTAGDCAVYFALTSNDANNRTYDIIMRSNLVSPADEQNTTGTHSTGTTKAYHNHNFGADTTGQTENRNSHWTIEDLLKIEFIIENTDPDAADKIRVYQAYIVLDNINVYNPVQKGSMGLWWVLTPGARV